MRTKFKHLLVLIIAVVVLQATATSSYAQEENPLDEYLIYLDEMGRTLSRWQGDDIEMGSWFFSAYAMMLMQGPAENDLQAFSTLERWVPSLWSDFKQLNPRYLIELAGGALAFDELMKLDNSGNFALKRPEEQYILVIAGYSYLRMLEGTVGDSLLRDIVRSAMRTNPSFPDIESSLVQAISVHYDSWVGKQFGLALSSSEWLDAEIVSVRNRGDSLRVKIDYRSSWAFPLDVLLISKNKDSTIVRFNPAKEEQMIVARDQADKIIIDPNHTLAEYYRYNNTWPRINRPVHLQPFAVLPDWSSYRIKVSPVAWSDWDDEKRYGLKFTSGFGVDLWPAYPSDYRHRFSLEINAHTKLDESTYYGGRLNYGHPVNRDRRLFSEFRIHQFSDWTGASAGLVKYVGRQSFLIQGTRLKYQRVKLSIETDSYQDTSIWKIDQRVNVLRLGYRGLSVTRYGDRLFVNIQSAYGRSDLGDFAMLKTNIDLSGVFWEKIVTGIQMVGGSQSPDTPCPYQFTHNYAWQDNLAAIPNFRGQTKLDHPTNNYLGLSVAGGYWLSWLQAKMFGSTMIFDNAGTMLSEARPHHAFGFGVEHKSFFTLGLYFPIWQSHPIEGEDPWAWRTQWRLVWNL